MALRTLRTYGGVKLSYAPALLQPSSMTVTANFVPVLLSPLLPKLYWRTDISPKVLIAPGVPTDVTIPQNSNWVEFFVEYTNDLAGALIGTAAGTFKGKVEFTITTDQYNPVFPGFGTKVFAITVQRANTRPNNRAVFFSSGKDAFDANWNCHFTRVHFLAAEGNARKLLMRLVDMNGDLLSEGKSEAALNAYAWSDNTQAGWPAYSGTANVVGSSFVAGGSTNLVIRTSKSTNGVVSEMTPVVWQGDWFEVPYGTQEIRIERYYGKSTLANALAAKQASKPSVTKLRDIFVLEAKDAGKHSPSFVGRDNRFTPHSTIITDLVTSA